MDKHYRKQIGGTGEYLVQQYYEAQGYHCKDKNFTIRGGELDLVMENATHLVVVEVKVVNYIENIHDYITPRKLFVLQRSIQTYLWKYDIEKQVRLDIVFVKGTEIIHLIEDVEI